MRQAITALSRGTTQQCDPEATDAPAGRSLLPPPRLSAAPRLVGREGELPGDRRLLVANLPAHRGIGAPPRGGAAALGSIRRDAGLAPAPIPDADRLHRRALAGLVGLAYACSLADGGSIVNAFDNTTSRDL